jgi:hypothetical protein
MTGIVGEKGRSQAEGRFIRPKARSGSLWHGDKEGVRGGTTGSPTLGSGGGAVVANSGSTGSDRSAGRLNAPRPALVETEFDGAPRVVNRQLVALVREEWRVVDRWWTDDPVDRRYFEVVLESGQNVCVYRDREAGAWFSQKA